MLKPSTTNRLFHLPLGIFSFELLSPYQRLISTLSRLRVKYHWRKRLNDRWYPTKQYGTEDRKIASLSWNVFDLSRLYLLSNVFLRDSCRRRFFAVFLISTFSSLTIFLHTSSASIAKTTMFVFSLSITHECSTNDSLFPPSLQRKLDHAQLHTQSNVS